MSAQSTAFSPESYTMAAHLQHLHSSSLWLQQTGLGVKPPTEWGQLRLFLSMWNLAAETLLISSVVLLEVTRIPE